MLTVIQVLLGPLRLVAGTVDQALAAGSFHNAREAMMHSELHREAWTQAMSTRNQTDSTASVA